MTRIAEAGLPVAFGREAEQVLNGRSWPGNVRELQQILERAAILAEDCQVILPEHLSFSSVQRPIFLGKGGLRQTCGAWTR